MSSAMSTNNPLSNAHQIQDREGLDVDWLLHSKRDFSSHTKDAARSKQDVRSETPPLNTKSDSSPNTKTTDVTTPSRLHTQTSPTGAEPPKTALSANTANNAPSPGGAPASPSVVTSRYNSPRETGTDDAKSASRNPVGSLKKEGRRSSWISSIGHKLSGSSNPARNNSVDSSKSKSPLNSPKVEFGNPFNGKVSKPDEKKDATSTAEPVIHVPSSPRRPSVLVAAGSETKIEQPGFLSSALRRLSSGSAVTLGKGAGTGAICPRKVMNIDHNRERVKIAEFDQSKLRRVAFCVDVEIAGISSQSDEQHGSSTDQVGHPPTSNQSHIVDQQNDKRDVKSAKYKEKGEGAALKNPQSNAEEKEQIGKTKVDITAEAKETQLRKQDSAEDSQIGDTNGQSEEQAAATTTRKKEKKKRSEAERKERKERKRKHAEANGLVPLEITRDDDDSDSTPSSTPPGASTPKKNSEQPTTDPLRIYKRCCQLRETTAMNVVKDQIAKPAATLAEAPGTVAIIDLSGARMALQDIQTLGDWLAVVPVRKLVLDDCDLSDEAVRIILSGLTGCKTSEQARHNRKLPRNISGKPGHESIGVIEKLSLKNNPAITSIGWKHIALFMHLSRSLIGIDLSGIPYPTSPRTPVTNNGHLNTPNNSGTSTKAVADMGALVVRAISQRFGDKLEELIVSGCGLSTQHVSDLIDAAIKCRIRRLGLAGNRLASDSLAHVVRYITSGVCEGLDLGGNNLHDIGHVLSEALSEKNPLFALSLAECDLTPDDLSALLPQFTKLANFKFIDLSRNRKLFDADKDAVPIFRKFLPKMQALKRIHLADVGLTPDHVIALSEIFPDCRSLAHINILENAGLINTLNAKSSDLQEEAAAFLASLMTAVRVSQTIVAIEIEVPSADTSEVVRALSSQVVAYSLRNMERSALTEVGIDSSHMPDKDAPEVLLHLVGHMEGYTENHDNDGPAPDEDYLIASTGIAKALRVCLGNKDASRHPSRNITPTASGTATPRRDGPPRPNTQKKPRDVSLELCESARKIRMRLRPALVKEDRAGNREGYRRLAALDSTLERIIQRFEDEYPQTKPIPVTTKNISSSMSDVGSSPLDSPDISRVTSRVDRDTYGTGDSQENGDDPYSVKLSRTSSNQSLAARALTHEEGRMHRFGQSMRRQLLAPTGTDDFAHGTSVHDAPEPLHLSDLRTKLEHLRGEEILHRVNEVGADEVIRELGVNAEELKALRREDPEGFQAFKDSQMAAQLNVRMLSEGGQQDTEGVDKTAISTIATSAAPRIDDDDKAKENSKGLGIYSQVTG